MEPGLAIAAFSFFFLFSFAFIMKRDIFFGFVYSALFLYTIVSQIGYVYFPQISEAISAYFGPEIFPSYNLFVFLSFIVFFVLFFFTRRWLLERPFYEAAQEHRPFLRFFFFFATAIHASFLLYFYITNYEAIDYLEVTDEEFLQSGGLMNAVFIVLFKWAVAIILSLYVFLRLRKKVASNTKIFVPLALVVLELGIFLSVAVKMGNRLDVLALLIGLGVFEVSNQKLNLKKLVVVAVSLLSLLYCLNLLKGVRGNQFHDERVSVSAIEKMILNDYYAPAHILIAAMEFNYVRPMEVLSSNVGNSLIKMQQPFLQEPVTDLFNAGVSSRSASYGFYIFSEGFMAMGWWGFLYNGLIAFLGFAVWRKMAMSTLPYYNLFLLPLFSTQIIAMVRAQSALFVKNLYMFFIPAMILVFFLSGFRPIIGKRRKRRSRPSASAQLSDF